MAFPVKKLFRPSLYLLTALFSLLLLLLGSGFIIARYYEDKVEKLFVDELNKRLLTEISVESIQFSFWKQFPYATLEFNGLTAKDATPASRKDTLMQASVLQMHFNLLGLYRGKYVIKRIDLQEATIKLKVYKDLTNNYHFWKDQVAEAGEGLSFALEKIVLDQVWLTYRNDASAQYYRLLVNHASGKGRFNDDIFKLNLAGKAWVEHFQSGETVYLRDKNLSMNLGARVNGETGDYSISAGELSVGSLNLGVSGSIREERGGKFIDLLFRSEGVALEKLVEELPRPYLSYLEKYKLSGQLKLDVTVKGKFGGSDLPAVEAAFSLDGATLASREKGLDIEEISLQGHYSNNASADPAKHVMILDKITTRLKEGKIEGRVEINSFAPYAIIASLTADLEMNEAFRLLPGGRIQDAAGALHLKVQYAGILLQTDSLSLQDFLGGQFSGEASWNKLSLEIKENPARLENLSGRLSFNNNDVFLQALAGNINNNTFQAEGYFRNLIPYLLTDTEIVDIKASLSSPELKLDKLTSPDQGEIALGFPERCKGEIILKANQLSMGSFRASKLNSVLEYRDKKLIFNQISMFLASGTFSGSLLIDASADKKISITSDAMLRNVDVNKLFSLFNNFGQDFLLDKNLKGIVNTEFQCAFSMSPGMKVNPASITATIDASIENGELIDFKPISGLGKFIRVDDLSRVRFSTLKNTLLIKDQLVHLPSMEVASDALNFTMSGTHTFKHGLDYRFQVLLSDLLSRKARKAKKENVEFGIEQDDQAGRTMLYIMLTGTAEHPVFRYDSKGVKGKIVSSYLNEKSQLRQAMKKEFSRDKEALDSNKLKDDHIKKLTEKGNFVIDWEGSLQDSLDAMKKKKTKPSPAGNKKNEQQKFKVIWDEDSATSR